MSLATIPPLVLALVARHCRRYEMYGRVASTCRAAHENLTNCTNIRDLFDYCIVHPDGATRIYYRAYLIHRSNDLPACILNTASGIIQKWIVYGKLHRDGGQPAYIAQNGGEISWWQDGRLVKRITR